MKKLLIGAALLAMLAPAVPAQTIFQRFRRQSQRINQGVRRGDLTRPEAARLRRSEGRLRRQVRRDIRDGGVFTRRERVRAERRLNQMNRRIYRQKHDGQRRW